MAETRPGRSAVQDMVDAMLQRSQAEHSLAEFTIMVSAEQSLLLPRDADKLWRSINGRLGYYRCHVYRGHEVIAMPLTDESLVLLCPLQVVGKATPPTYIGNLATGAIGIAGES
jgi:hypothetical protein